jgi:hypothetical protein
VRTGGWTHCRVGNTDAAPPPAVVRRASYAGDHDDWRVTDGVATSLSVSGLFAGAAAFVGPRTVLALRRIRVSENVPVTDGLWRRRARPAAACGWACGYGQRVQPRDRGGQHSADSDRGTRAVRARAPRETARQPLGRRKKAWYAYG